MDGSSSQSQASSSFGIVDCASEKANEKANPVDLEKEFESDEETIDGKNSKKWKGQNPPRETSEVWKDFIHYFDEKGERRAKCKHCEANFASQAKKHGTSTLWNHLKSCSKNPNKPIDKKQKVIVFEPKKGGNAVNEGQLVAKHYTKEACREAVAEYIVLAELPFKHVEVEGFKRFCLKLQPSLDPPSRMTIARDIYKRYLDEKKKLKNILKKERVSITIDYWTSIQNIGYMVITAHWVDSHFNLQKRIINFSQITDHHGDTIAKAIEASLIEWGIHKIFSVTVYSASSNDKAIKYLKKKFEEKKEGLVLDGKFLHMRCCAHIINLIVKDGLKEKQASINSIQNAVRYVRSSTTRLLAFKECVRMEGIPCKGFLCLDVTTRWNSTYLMFNQALKFQKAFNRLDGDQNYFKYFEEVEKDGKKRDGPPDELDWENAKIFEQYLAIFYEITLSFSGSTYVTSNKYFWDICQIQEHLYDLSDEAPENSLLASMASNMRLKYEKYWGKVEESNGCLLLATVLDPRYKLEYLHHCLSAFHNSRTCKSIINNVEDDLRKMFDYYNEKEFGVLPQPIEPQAQATSQLEIVKQTSLSSSFMLTKATKFSRHDSFVQQRHNQDSGKIKNEVDRYLNEPPKDIDTTNIDDFDILKWWMVNSVKCKVLSHIVRDVLAVLVTTVASEAAFSMGGRILDPFRSSLSPKTIEALICLKNWLSESHQPIIVMEYMDELEVLETSENLEIEMIEQSNTSSVGTAAS